MLHIAGDRNAPYKQSLPFNIKMLVSRMVLMASGEALTWHIGAPGILIMLSPIVLYSLELELGPVPLGMYRSP